MDTETVGWGALIGGFVLLVGAHIRRAYKSEIESRNRVRWTDANRWERD